MMAIGERIRSCRQRAGMSQEKVADLVGVSRQAVAKWEAGQSFPSTENLFKLAEILGTTVDMLLDANSRGKPPPAEPVSLPHNIQEEKEADGKGQKGKENIRTAAVTALGYLVIYLIGRLIWCDFSESSFLGWLVSAAPSGENSYLFGWLLSSHLFWAAMAISVVPALFGKRVFALCTGIAFAAGLLLGILFGPYPEGAFYGHGHYGWAIWGGVFLLAVVAGIVLEWFIKKGRAMRGK